MATIYGSCIIQARAFDGVTCYLIPSSAFSSEPQATTPVPVSGAIATVVSGPANGQSGGYRFDGVNPNTYYVGYSFGGANAYDYHDVQTVVFSSGAVTVAVPSTFTGNAFDVNNTSDLFNLAVNSAFYGSPTVPAVTGHLAGPLVITQPDNNVFLRFVDTVPLSGAHIIDAGPYHTLRFSGNAGDPPARHQFSLQDKLMPSDTHGLDGSLGWNTFTVDADGQVHCQPKVFNNLSSSNNHMLRLTAWCDGQPGIGFGSGMEYYAQRLDGAGVQIAMMQAYWAKLTAGQESSALEIYNTQSGQVTICMQFDPSGPTKVLGPHGYLQIPADPERKNQYGLISLGAGGWVGAGGDNFAGSFSGTYIAVAATSGFQGDFVNLQNRGVPQFKIDHTGQVVAVITDANAAVNSYILSLRKTLQTGVTASGGFGIGIQFDVLDDHGVTLEGGNIQVLAGSVASGHVSTNMKFGTLSSNVGVVALTLDNAGNCLAAGGLGVGNSVTSATAGTVVRKSQVFDAAGNALGYLHIFDS